MDQRRPPARSEPSLAASLTIIVILLLFGSAGWWSYLRPERELDSSSIGSISMDLAGWQGEDEPISEGVERMLRADAQVQRSYRNMEGELVWLYVGYYSTKRGGRPEHTPWACYPSAGWLILASRERELEATRGGEALPSVNELVVEQSGYRRLVYFWYKTTRSRAVASERALTIDHVWGRLSASGRADGALVRVSTSIDAGGIERARERLDRFVAPLVRELGNRWPASVDAGPASISR